MTTNQPTPRTPEELEALAGRCKDHIETANRTSREGGDAAFPAWEIIHDSYIALLDAAQQIRALTAALEEATAGARVCKIGYDGVRVPDEDGFDGRRILASGDIELDRRPNLARYLENRKQ